MESARYPRRLRLRLAADFRRVLDEGLVFPGRECLVRIRPNGLAHPRLGIAAPRRFGDAVRRNRFRRLVREAFRGVQADLADRDVMVSPRKGLREPTLAGLRADLLEARRRARPQDRRGPRPGAKERPR